LSQNVNSRDPSIFLVQRLQQQVLVFLFQDDELLRFGQVVGSSDPITTFAEVAQRNSSALTGRWLATLHSTAACRMADLHLGMVRNDIWNDIWIGFFSGCFGG
jgi:hypothetical protein